MGSATRIVTGTSMFEEMLGDIDYPRDLYKQKVYYRVGCVKMAAPRDPRFEYILEMGRPYIDCIFNGQPIGSKALTFVFPERYMSVHEQRAMIYNLERHPSADEIETCDIITSSPLLVGEFHREQLRILTWPDDDQYNGNV